MDIERCTVCWDSTTVCAVSWEVGRAYQDSGIYTHAAPYLDSLETTPHHDRWHLDAINPTHPSRIDSLFPPFVPYSWLSNHLLPNIFFVQRQKCLTTKYVQIYINTQFTLLNTGLQNSITHDGESLTFPVTSSALRINGHIVIKGRPCKIVDMSTSKTGKHGHAKIHFVGIDIFTGKKLEDVVPSTYNSDVPSVHKEEYQLVCLDSWHTASIRTSWLPRTGLTMIMDTFYWKTWMAIPRMILLCPKAILVNKLWNMAIVPVSVSKVLVN